MKIEFTRVALDVHRDAGREGLVGLADVDDNEVDAIGHQGVLRQERI